ncbi:ArnT family glycosyltransferase [Terriglobus sp.]|uniref:ArnT family glycosyltransferase n=1 Tax=Terriglobus sp. TaxID=1889013 RepID=UPI003AFFD25E
MPSTTDNRFTSPALARALKLAALFAVVKLLLQFALTLWTEHLGYSYFRDEFYYIACGHHLAWGYVDHGPIVALQARLGEILFGDSVFGIRVLSAFAGALTVFLGGILCWSLGGRRPAQALTCIGLIVTPQYIGVDGFLSMNSFEAVFWSGCLLALIMVARGASPALWWAFFGICAGVGLLNKPSMAFFLIAAGIGLLVTPQRRLLASRWTALGIALLLLIALPNLLWQIHNHWPTAEFLHNGRVEGKNLVLNPLEFFLAQFSNMHPLNALLWITGVVALLRGKSIRNTRWLGFTFVAFFIIMYISHAKDYYLQGIYPAFFAAGAIAWEHRRAASTRVQRDRIFAFPVYESLLLLTGLVILPMSSPVLRPSAWVRYTAALHLRAKPTESGGSGPLPQFFADRFGWDQQYSVVSGAFHALSASDQRRVCIFGKDYGEAGNIDFRNHLFHDTLPPAISGQNSYWTWGTHDCDPNLVIAIIPDTQAAVGTKYASVTLLGHNSDPYSMPFERRNIYLLRDRKPGAPFRWADERFYY